MLASPDVWRFGDDSRLVSPTYNPSAEEECFQFWYRMSGPVGRDNHIVVLKVFFQDGGLLGHPKFINTGRM